MARTSESETGATSTREVRPPLDRPTGPSAAAACGSAALPGCKSYGQRSLVLAAFLPGTHGLAGLPDGQDMQALGGALRTCGARVPQPEGGLVHVHGIERGAVPAPEGTVELGESGTSARILPVVVAMLGGRARFDGAPRLRERPFGPLVELLRGVGCAVDGETLPLDIEGRGCRALDVLRVDAETTTQVASGALLGVALAAARGRAASSGAVRAVGPRAAGYLELTVDTLRRFGWRGARAEAVAGANGGQDLLLVPGPRAADAVAEIEVPIDASSAVWPLAFDALHGMMEGQTLAPAASGPPSVHPDRDARAELARLAAAGDREVRLEDLGSHPDAFPALCVCAAAGRPDGARTVLAGAPALRVKESDRIDAMANGLAAAGVRVEPLPDGLVVTAGIGRSGRADTPVELPTVADHRIVMALALLGTVRPGGVRVGHASAVGKSWPGFWNWLARVADVRPAG